MRRLALSLVTLAALGAATPISHAQPAPEAAEARPAAEPLPAAEPAGTSPTGAPMTQRKVEVLQHRPSGFWTSNRPATNGAYRWRLLGIGIALAAITGALTFRLMRRASQARAARVRS